MALCEHSWGLCHFSVASALFSSVCLETKMLDLPNGNFFFFFAKCASYRDIEIEMSFQGVLSALGLHHRHTESSVFFLCGTPLVSDRQQHYPSCFQGLFPPSLYLTVWPFIIYIPLVEDSIEKHIKILRNFSCLAEIPKVWLLLPNRCTLESSGTTKTY